MELLVLGGEGRGGEGKRVKGDSWVFFYKE
jgi:hypothetical protein